MLRLIESLSRGLLFVCAASTALAGQVTFDNGSPDQDNAFLSDYQTLTDTAGSFHFISAEDFQLGAGRTTLVGIQWWGNYNELANAGVNPPTDNFLINIYDDLNAGPLHSVAVGNSALRVDTGDLLTTPSGRQFDIYQYSLEIAPINLMADTTYWISIANNAVLQGDIWWWETSNSTEGNALSFDLDNPGLGWEEYPFELAFNLTTVPIPAAAWLFGSALLGLGVTKKRKKA